MEEVVLSGGGNMLARGGAVFLGGGAGSDSIMT